MTTRRAGGATPRLITPDAPPPGVGPQPADLPRALHQIVDAAAWARLVGLNEVAVCLEGAVRAIKKEMAGRRPR